MEASNFVYLVLLRAFKKVANDWSFPQKLLFQAEYIGKSFCVFSIGRKVFQFEGEPEVAG